MNEVIGFHCACELVRRHIPRKAALEALEAELRITTPEAVAALSAVDHWVGADSVSASVPPRSARQLLGAGK